MKPSSSSVKQSSSSIQPNPISMRPSSTSIQPCSTYFLELAIIKITSLWWRRIWFWRLFRWFSRLTPIRDSSISRGRRKSGSTPENATLFPSLWTSWHLHSRIFARTRWGEDVKIFLLPLRQPLWTLCDFTSSHLCLDILLWKVESLVLTFYVQWRLQEQVLLYL